MKHVSVRDRLLWHPAIRGELKRAGYAPGTARRWWSGASHEYFRLRRMARASARQFRKAGRVRVQALLKGDRIRRGLWAVLRGVLAPFLWITRTAGRLAGLVPPLRPRPRNELNVLVAGGYGYGNVGDEAQLAADLACWHAADPHAHLTVLTPDEPYTRRVHQVQTEPAPRNVWFQAADKPHYRRSDGWFRFRYRLLWPLLRANAALIRAGLPTVGLSAARARLLDAIHRSDVLFFCGGGYLTGMTASRLWEGMLLIRLAAAMGVPTVLSGQTIGVFTDRSSRRLARRGLKRAALIGVRDVEDSPAALAGIGIDSEKIEATFDDALFCPAADAAALRAMLVDCGADPGRPYAAVNCHRWGQSADVSSRVMRRMAAALDGMVDRLGVQIVFVPMHASDQDAIGEVAAHMKQPSAMVEHGYRAEAAIAAIRGAALVVTMKHHPIVFAMGGAVPTVAIALDDYYVHKNRGAMALFGQEAFLVSAEPDRLADAVLERVEAAWTARARIAGHIREHLEALRPRAGAVIHRWLAARSLR
jgi:polysaccharide pyruvyl transferase WcaK-like protein